MKDFLEITNLLSECWHAFLLGLVQGVTEFLPISSTAHLKAVPIFLGWGDPGVTFTAVIQLGSVIAVIGYFKKDLLSISKGIFYGIKNKKWNQSNSKLGLGIIIGSLPIILCGIFIKAFWKEFDQSVFRSIPCIGLVSIIMALLLYSAERKGAQKKSITRISKLDSLIIGIGQMFALIPGMSRSGATLSMALLIGWKRRDAAHFSFLLGIPAISIAGLVELLGNFNSLDMKEIVPILIGISSATLFSWLSIDWLLKYLQRHSTFIFVVYRLIFGITLIRWWLTLSTN